jgi:hypothetical protein
MFVAAAALLLGIAAVALSGCEAPNAENAPAQKPPAPAGAQLEGGIGASFLRLEQHDAPPAPCDAAIYGTIAAASGVGLCVCQPQADGQPGDWIQLSGQSCWPDNR